MFIYSVSSEYCEVKGGRFGVEVNEDFDKDVAFVIGYPIHSFLLFLFFFYFVTLFLDIDRRERQLKFKFKCLLIKYHQRSSFTALCTILSLLPSLTFLFIPYTHIPTHYLLLLLTLFFIFHSPRTKNNYLLFITTLT